MRWASRLTTLTLVALGLSALGLLLPPVGLAAIVVGFVAIKRARTAHDKRIAQAVIGVSSAGLVGFGALLWTVSRPSPPSPAIECQVGLEALTLAQEAHRKTRGRYAASQEELGIAVAERFFLEPHGEHLERLQALGVGRTGQCPACTVTMACLETPEGKWWTITSGGKPVAHERP